MWVRENDTNLWNLLKKEKQTNKQQQQQKKSNKEQKKGKRFANPKKGRKTDRNEGIVTKLKFYNQRSAVKFAESVRYIHHGEI